MWTIGSVLYCRSETAESKGTKQRDRISIIRVYWESAFTPPAPATGRQHSMQREHGFQLRIPLPASLSIRSIYILIYTTTLLVFLLLLCVSNIRHHLHRSLKLFLGMSNRGVPSGHKTATDPPPLRAQILENKGGGQLGVGRFGPFLDHFWTVFPCKINILGVQNRQNFPPAAGFPP